MEETKDTEKPSEKIEKVEKSSEEKVKDRKERIKNWLRNPYNLALVGILVLAFVIRLYYFFLTKNQALWWDEAEYALKAKSFAFGTPDTGWAPEREIVVPFLFSLILRAGGGEIILRVIQLIVSILTVVFTQILFAKIISKKAAIFATFGMAFFWLHVFFTQRILLYLWAPLIYLILIYLFYEGYINNKKKYLIAFAILAAVGLEIYFSIGFLLFGLLIYVLLTEGFSFLKNKKVWIVLIVFLLAILPFAIYFQSTFGFPIPRLAIGYKATTQEPGAGISGLLTYISMFPSRAGWAFAILSFFGLIYFLITLFLGLGIKNYLKETHRWLLIFICFFVPFLMYTLYGTIGGSGTFYDAFILSVFPFAFAFAGLFLEKILNFNKKYQTFAVLLVILLLLIHAYYGIKNSSDTIVPKLNSYDSVKFAGLWIKENSQPGDIIISRSRPQNTYYSERQTINYPKSEEELNKLIEEKRPKYIIDSVWEQTDQWVHEYPSKYNSTVIPVQIYFLDVEKTQPSLIIYKVNY